jgi:uncharacterized protein
MTGERSAHASGGGAAGAFDGPPFHSLYERFSDPAVRDLAWLLFSADLLRPQPEAPLAEPWASDGEARTAATWLAQLDRDPAGLARLHTTLGAAHLTRLGFYAETLLAWYLSHGPAPRLIAANVALRRAGRTLGECDFLVQASNRRRLHWELAVKCYLYAGLQGEASSRLADYVGPNLRDRFDLKLAHMLNHQLRLSTREEFASLGFEGPWRAQMFVKGWLFYRVGKGAGTPPGDPPELAVQHGRGWWVTHADWAGFAEREAAQGWSVLPRLAWLAPRRLAPGAPQSAEAASGPEPATDFPTGFATDFATGSPARTAIATPMDPATLFASLTRAHEPVMVAAFSADGAGGYAERSRGFIVPDDWPERAQAFANQ